YVAQPVELRRRGAERLDARRVRGGELLAVEVVAVPEERLPVVLGRAQVTVACADRMPVLERGIGLLDETVGESRPRGVPAVAVTLGNQRCDVEALAQVGHTRVALADAALQLPVEAHVVGE